MGIKAQSRKKDGLQVKDRILLNKNYSSIGARFWLHLFGKGGGDLAYGSVSAVVYNIQG